MLKISTSLILSIFFAGSLTANTDDPLDEWISEIKKIPKRGTVYCTVELEKDSKKTQQPVRKMQFKDGYLLVSWKTKGGGKKGEDQTTVVIKNPSYFARIIKEGEQPWQIRKLSIYSDADFEKNFLKYGQGANYMALLRSGFGYASLAKKNSYEVQSVESSVTRLLFSKVENIDPREPKVRSFHLDFESDQNSPSICYGQSANKEFLFHVKMLNWKKIGDAIVPQQCISEKKSANNRLLAKMVFNFDYSDFEQSIEHEQFFLSAYGIKEPKLPPSRFGSPIVWIGSTFALLILVVVFVLYSKRN